MNKPVSHRVYQCIFWISMGILIGIILFRATFFSMAWKIAILFSLGFLLLVPIYQWITGHFEKLLWFVLFASIPLDFDIHLSYREYVGTFNGILLNLTDLSLLFLFLFWLYRRIINKKSIPFSLSLMMPAIAFFLVHFTSLIHAQDVSLSLFSIVQMAKILLLFCFIIHTMEDETLLSLAWKFLVICLILESIICLLQFVTKTNFTTTMKIAENYGEEVFRVGGTTGSPNVTASYLGSLLVIPIISFFVMKKKLKFKVFVFLSIGLGVCAFVLTQTRGAWINFCIGLFLFFIFNRSIRHRGSIVLGFFAIFGVFVCIFHRVIFERFSEGWETLLYRLELTKTAFLMIKTHPLFGIGANNYALVMSDYVPYFLTQERWVVHNRYLLIASELGILGLLCFLYFLGSALYYTWRAIRSSNLFVVGFGNGIFYALLIFMLQMLLESLDGRICDAHLWVLAGLGIALFRFSQRTKLNNRMPSL